MWQQLAERNHHEQAWDLVQAIAAIPAALLVVWILNKIADKFKRK